MTKGKSGGSAGPGQGPDTAHEKPWNAAALRPTEAQRRYLERGLREPGGKLPLFDEDGRAVSRKTIDACVTHGWAKPWLSNPIKPDWLVCRLTDAGYALLLSERDDGKPQNATGK